MTDRITKLQRWLDLVAYLAGRRYPVLVEDLREHIPAYVVSPDAGEKEKETVRRMFERDKKELREMGIPIETVDFSVNYGREHAEGYRLARRDFHLPYMKLVTEARGAGTAPATTPGSFEIAEDEAGAALEGLREVASLPAFPLASHARSAFRKLAFDLEPEFVDESPVVFVEDPEAAASGRLLSALSRAVLGHKRVSFLYHGMQRDADSSREVRPYGLLFQHGRWYLVGHDEDRDAVRMFRVGRMERLDLNAKAPGTPDFEVPPDFRLEAYGGRKAWELGDDEAGAVDATVLFRFPRSLWAERNRHGRLLEERADGAQLRGFDVHRRDPFLRWVLSLAGDARIESPEDLRRAFQQLAARVAERHREVTRD
jgi:predicted DNA-binding transcriptional regulator YafY